MDWSNVTPPELVSALRQVSVPSTAPGIWHNQRSQSMLDRYRLCVVPELMERAEACGRDGQLDEVQHPENTAEVAEQSQM